jgi:hypothetical protein
MRHHVNHLRQVDHHQPPAVHQQVVRGQVPVREPQPGQAGEGRHELLPQAGQLVTVGAGLRQPRRAGAVRVADELEQHLGAGDLHRVRHGQPRGAQLAQRGELGVRPLPGDGLPAERAPVGGRAVHPAFPSAAPFEVPRVPVEQPVPRVAVPLGREQARPAAARHAAAQQVDIGFLAGLQDAELGVDRGQFGHEPLRVRLRAALGGRGLVPGGPAVALGQPVGRVVCFLRGEPGQVPPALGGRRFVVEILPALTAGPADPAVRGVEGFCAVAHCCSSGGLWKGRAERSPWRA